MLICMKNKTNSHNWVSRDSVMTIFESVFFLRKCFKKNENARFLWTLSNFCYI